VKDTVDNCSDDGSMPWWTIALIVVGSLVSVIVAGGLFCWYKRRKGLPLKQPSSGAPVMATVVDPAHVASNEANPHMVAP